MSFVYLGLGTNLGDREENLRAALRELTKDFTVERISSIYETDPVGIVDQPAFLNMAIVVSTQLSANEALEHAKKIEQLLGRVAAVRNGPRIIDVDILFYDDKEMNTTTLTIPHPRLHKRAFVLIPLNDIAPDFMHPVLNKTISELCSALTKTAGVQKTSIIL